MAGLKRRQEEDRGMRINPENFNIEGAEGYARTRRQHRRVKGLSPEGLPGTWAHIETSGKHAEQERPDGYPKDRGGVNRERIGGTHREGPWGVGSVHSSDEASEGCRGRRSGAKGLTEQGTRSGER